MGEENLIPFDKLTEEQQREISRKGGIASSIAKKQKKTMREQMEMLLSLPLKNEGLKAQIQELGIGDEEVTNQMALLLAMYKKGLHGDVQAFNAIQATAGEKPIDKVEHSGAMPVVINDDIK